MNTYLLLGGGGGEPKVQPEAWNQPLEPCHLAPGDDLRCQNRPKDHIQCHPSWSHAAHSTCSRTCVTHGAWRWASGEVHVLKQVRWALSCTQHVPKQAEWMADPACKVQRGTGPIQPVDRLHTTHLGHRGQMSSTALSLGSPPECWWMRWKQHIYTWKQRLGKDRQ